MPTSRRLTTDVHVTFRLEPDGATWIDHAITAPDGQQILVRSEQVTTIRRETRDRIAAAFELG